MKRDSTKTISRWDGRSYLRSNFFGIALKPSFSTVLNIGNMSLAGHIATDLDNSLCLFEELSSFFIRSSVSSMINGCEAVPSPPLHVFRFTSRILYTNGCLLLR